MISFPSPEEHTTALLTFFKLDVSILFLDNWKYRQHNAGPES